MFRLLILTLTICSADGKRRRGNVDDLPYCIGERTEGCRTCVGTPYYHDNGYSQKMAGCCHGAFYNGRCHTNSFIDRNGKLCSFPAGLDQNGNCYVKYPASLIAITFTLVSITSIATFFVYIFVSNFLK